MNGILQISGASTAKGTLKNIPGVAPNRPQYYLKKNSNMIVALGYQRHPNGRGGDDDFVLKVALQHPKAGEATFVSIWGYGYLAGSLNFRTDQNLMSTGCGALHPIASILGYKTGTQLMKALIQVKRAN